jgi:hypothetical protein
LPTTDTFSDWTNGWKHNVDVGFNGSDGNSRTFSGRGGIGAERKAQDMETKAGVSYVFAKDRSTKTKSRGEAFLRNDWIWPESRWGLWALGRLEYDEFQLWDWRASVFFGPSYTFIKNERTLLRGRAGLGAVYEFGGDAEEELEFSGMLGVDFEHKLTERSKIFATVEWIPNFSDWYEYRMVGAAGYELLVDPESGMLLKLGVSDRYDSDPGTGVERNDFEYFGTLSWTF